MHKNTQKLHGLMTELEQLDNRKAVFCKFSETSTYFQSFQSHSVFGTDSGGKQRLC